MTSIWQPGNRFSESPRSDSNWKQRRQIRKSNLLRLLLISRLGVLDCANQFGQSSWIHVADRDCFEILRAESHHVKSRALGRQFMHRHRAGFLQEKD